MRSSRLAFPSYQSRSFSASARRSSSLRASTWSVTNGQPLARRCARRTGRRRLAESGPRIPPAIRARAQMTECRGRDEADDRSVLVSRARRAASDASSARPSWRAPCSRAQGRVRGTAADRPARGVLPIVSEPKSCRPFARQALELTEEAQEPRLSVLVARVVRVPHELGSAHVRACARRSRASSRARETEGSIDDRRSARRALKYPGTPGSPTPWAGRATSRS